MRTAPIPFFSVLLVAALGSPVSGTPSLSESPVSAPTAEAPAKIPSSMPIAHRTPHSVIVSGSRDDWILAPVKRDCRPPGPIPSPEVHPRAVCLRV
jgi:hypothetical protein